MSLESIGLTSFFGLPWILKFLWAPLVDHFGTRRQWLTFTEAVLALLFLVAGFSAANGSDGVQMVAVLFLIASFFAASQDTAIDGYYMEALDVKGQSRFVGYRVMAYRLAMMTGTGVIVSLAVWKGWGAAFWVTAILMGVLVAYHTVFLPRCEEPGQRLSRLLIVFISPVRLGVLGVIAGLTILVRWVVSFPAYEYWYQSIPVVKNFSFASWVSIGLLATVTTVAVLRKRLGRLILSKPDSFYAKSFLSFVERDHLGLLLSTVIFLRTGEFLLSAMVSPFMVDMGLKVHYGWISGGLGLPCSIAGALLGGMLISKMTLKKVMWPFLLAQNLTNLVYMALALAFSSHLVANSAGEIVSPGFWGIASAAAVHGFDQFAGGLGTAVLMTLLMKISAGPNRTSHFAIGTGLMNVSSLFTGVASGFLAAWLGYGIFFGLSFLVSIPGMVLVVLLLKKEQI